jgi:dUTP pyrophosphatase
MMQLIALPERLPMSLPENNASALWPQPQVQLAVTVLPHGRGLPLPAYESDGAAGMDLLAAVDEIFDLQPRSRALIPTGLAFAIPPGYEVQVRPRSGLALKQGLSVLNTPGTIDSDYRGEVKVIVINHNDVSVSITRGMRIAQMVVQPVVRAMWHEVDSLPDTVRGTGGFGSTGH